jgi:hypothetical protein
MTKEGNYSFDDFENTETEVGADKSAAAERVPFLPAKGQKWPFDVRILVNPIASELGKIYHETNVHPIQVGGKWLNIPCPRSLGKTCYMCDTRWGSEDRRKELEAIGAGASAHPEHNEFKKHENIIALFKQKKQYMFMAALRNDPKLYFFYAGPALIKSMFGDKAKATKGAVASFKEFGVSAFNPNNTTGWITVNKTGQKLDTVYTATPTVQTVVKDRVKSEMLVEEALHPDVVNAFSNIEGLPRVLESFKNRMWSEDEIQTFVDSACTVVPERIAKWVGAIEKPSKVETASFTENSLSVESFDPF